MDSVAPRIQRGGRPSLTEECAEHPASYGITYRTVASAVFAVAASASDSKVVNHHPVAPSGSSVVPSAPRVRAVSPEAARKRTFQKLQLAVVRPITDATTGVPIALRYGVMRDSTHSFSRPRITLSAPTQTRVARVESRSVSTWGGPPLSALHPPGIVRLTRRPADVASSRAGGRSTAVGSARFGSVESRSAGPFICPALAGAVPSVRDRDQSVTPATVPSVAAATAAYRHLEPAT